MINIFFIESHDNCISIHVWGGEQERGGERERERGGEVVGQDEDNDNGL